MTTCLALLLCLTPTLLLAQSPVAGDWLLTEDVYGTPLRQRLTVKVDGSTLSGTLGRESIAGAITGDAIRFAITSGTRTDEFTGTISADRLTGTLVRTDTSDPTPFKTSW